MRVSQACHQANPRRHQGCRGWLITTDAQAMLIEVPCGCSCHGAMRAAR